MPLFINPIRDRVTKGNILRWILDTNEVKKQQVGSIEIRGRQAIVEIPESAGPRLVKRLDGGTLLDTVVQVWFASEEGDSDPTGHFEQLGRWLDLEQRAEAEEAAEWQRTAADTDSSTGLANLIVRKEDSALGGYVALTLGRRNAMQALPATQLSVGTPIRLKATDADAGGATSADRRGIVTRVTKTEIEVAISRPLSPDQEGSSLRIDAADDETSMLRSRAALAKARHARDERLGDLRDVCLGAREPEFGEVPAVEFLNTRLDESQQAAVRFALSAKDVAVMHGPPGTGKTTAVVELIRQIIRGGGKVLACAPSNLGVDNLFERLLDRGENAVRIGHLARVLPHLRDRTLGAMVPAHRDVRRIKKLRIEAHDLFRQADRGARGRDRDSRSALRDEAKSLLADARAAEADIAQEILRSADVVCATNTGLDAHLLGALRFNTVVLDEACQGTEPSCWIPMLRADRVVFAGDHCQLPPTIRSRDAAAEGFNISLQERLVHRFGDRVSRMLSVQYRMHEAIMAHSSATFYGNRLKADSSVAGHRLCDLPGVRVDELTESPLHFIDTSGACHDEEREASGTSLFNREEARLALKKVRDLKARGVRPSDIAVITPYTAQVRLLGEWLDDDAVEAGSVDGFQGREKEAVIISLVRSNPEKEIGFLSDTRRMNVAITRARRKLIVIGDSATISANPFYERLLEHFDQHGAYHVVWEEEED